VSNFKGFAPGTTTPVGAFEGDGAATAPSAEAIGALVSER
jgi:hypothetical protein